MFMVYQARREVLMLRDGSVKVAGVLDNGKGSDDSTIGVWLFNVTDLLFK